MAKGKYADIIGKLPRSFGEQPDQQQKINAIKDELLNGFDPGTPRLSSDALEDLLFDVAAMLQVINDAMLRPVGSQRGGSRLAQLYRDARRIKAVFDAQEKSTNLLIAALEQIVFNQYEVEATTSIKLADGDTIRIQEEPHAVVTDKAANRKWAMANGLEDSLSLPWQTVNALTKEYLLRGEEPPDGVTAEARPKLVYTKG